MLPNFSAPRSWNCFLRKMNGSKECPASLGATWEVGRKETGGKVLALVSPAVDVSWSQLDSCTLGWIWFGLETSSHIV